MDEVRESGLNVEEFCNAIRKSLMEYSEVIDAASDTLQTQMRNSLHRFLGDDSDGPVRNHG